MIQLRYGTGNPTSAIFCFKLNSIDGEEFSFRLDNEVGSIKVPSHFIWLSKQVAKSNSSKHYLLNKCGKSSNYQKEYSSSYKASKKFNISKYVPCKRKFKPNKAIIYKELYLNLYNERINKINIFNDIFAKKNDNFLGVHCNYIKLTRPTLELAVKNEYIKLFRTDMLCNFFPGNLNLSSITGNVGKYQSYKSLNRSNRNLDKNNTGYLMSKYETKVSKLDMNRSLFKEGSTIDVESESITSLSKSNSKIDVLKTYLKLSQNGFNINYKENILVDNSNPEGNILKEYIGLAINNNKLKIDNSKSLYVFHKELSKYNDYRFFIKKYNILNKLVTDMNLYSTGFNTSLNNMYFLKNKKGYLDKQHEFKRLHKKSNDIVKYDLGINLKTTPTSPKFSNDIVFAYRNGLCADIFNHEKTLDIIGEDMIIESNLKPFYRSDSNLKVFNSYDWLYYNSKDVDIKFSDINFDLSSKNLFEGNLPLMFGTEGKYTDILDGYVEFKLKEQNLLIEDTTINLIGNGKDVSIRPTDIMFDISEKKIIVYDTILNFDTEGVGIEYGDELSRWLDSSGKTLGIFSSDWVSNSSDNLSIENYLIMGYNHNKRLDKYNFTFLGFEKDSFDFLIPDEIRVAMSEQSIVIPDNLFGHAKDFVPPIKILKKASDELLLPREGFDYSTYKNEVFGTNLTINPKYIKGITEEGNPIINVPIENPIKYYTDIAKEYIDVDVVIMRKVLELLYKNWRKNIHRHAGLEPTKAINNILEITHKDLLEFYTSVTDKNRIKHAERSLKLFAWYCEMGLLSNSDKEVVYKKSNGVFDFWNELPHYGIDDKVTYKGISKDEVTDFTNFTYSDENKFILSSLPGQNASMAISNMPQVIETNLKFKAYVLGKGVLRVSVDSRVYTYSERVNIVDVPLPSDRNEIKIRFFPSNEASSLDIAEFVINNRYNDSYELVYTGKVKNMNYTLQYVLDFMSIAGDSIEEVQPVLKSTAQLAYALDRFKEYMEIHHDNKFKGKRLTVRK